MCSSHLNFETGASDGSVLCDIDTSNIQVVIKLVRSTL